VYYAVPRERFVKRAGLVTTGHLSAEVVLRGAKVSVEGTNEGQAKDE
jgi:hypothetical protein